MVQNTRRIPFALGSQPIHRTKIGCVSLHEWVKRVEVVRVCVRKV
jgi:hypothetical protein